MAFEIIDNIEVPATTATRVRSKGEFGQTLDELNVGQGFVFDSDKPLKAHYPKVSPSKFPVGDGELYKRFKLWVAGPGKIGVKRVENTTKREAKAE